MEDIFNYGFKEGLVCVCIGFNMWCNKLSSVNLNLYFNN